jgi:hypothetical protein
MCAVAVHSLPTESSVAASLSQREMSLGAFSGYQRSAYAANFSFSTQASYC